MHTIEIVSERSPEQPLYRAIYGSSQATGATPGQALDSLENQALQAGVGIGATLVIVQRFRPDDLFNEQQQTRLRELMERFHQGVANGDPLSPELQAELESLVEAELQANITRSAQILQQTQRSE